MELVEDALLPLDFISPAQFADMYTLRSERDTPEKALMRAILQDALDCLCSNPNRPHRGKDRYEAWCWFLSTDSRWLYSFERICQHLGIDAVWLRNQVKKIREGELVYKRYQFRVQHEN